MVSWEYEFKSFPESLILLNICADCSGHGLESHSGQLDTNCKNISSDLNSLYISQYTEILSTSKKEIATQVYCPTCSWKLIFERFIFEQTNGKRKYVFANLIP